MPLAVLLVVAAVTSPLEELLGDVDALQRVLVPPAALASLEKTEAAVASGGGGGRRPPAFMADIVARPRSTQDQAASTAEADADEEIDCDATKILGNLGEDDPDAGTVECRDNDFKLWSNRFRDRFGPVEWKPEAETKGRKKSFEECTITIDDDSKNAFRDVISAGGRDIGWIGVVTWNGGSCVIFLGLVERPPDAIPEGEGPLFGSEGGAMISIREARDSSDPLKLTIDPRWENRYNFIAAIVNEIAGLGTTDSEGNNRYVTGVNADGGGLAHVTTTCAALAGDNTEQDVNVPMWKCLRRKFKVLEKVIEAKHAEITNVLSEEAKSFMMKADNFGFHDRYTGEELNSLTEYQAIADVADENSPDELQHLAQELTVAHSAAGFQRIVVEALLTDDESILKMLYPGGTHPGGDDGRPLRQRAVNAATAASTKNVCSRTNTKSLEMNMNAQQALALRRNIKAKGFTYYDPFPDDYDEQEHSGMHGAIVHDLFKDYTEKNGGICYHNAIDVGTFKSGVMPFGGTLGRNSATPATQAHACQSISSHSCLCKVIAGGGQAVEAGDTIPTGEDPQCAKYEALGFSVTAPGSASGLTFDFSMTSRSLNGRNFGGGIGGQMNEAAAKKIYMALWEGLRDVGGVKPGKRKKAPAPQSVAAETPAFAMNLRALLGAVSRQNLERESDNEGENEEHEMCNVGQFTQGSQPPSVTLTLKDGVSDNWEMMAQVIVGGIATETEIDGTRLSLPEDAGGKATVVMTITEGGEGGGKAAAAVAAEIADTREAHKRPTDASDTWSGFLDAQGVTGVDPGPGSATCPDGHTSAFSMASTPCFGVTCTASDFMPPGRAKGQGACCRKKTPIEVLLESLPDEFLVSTEMQQAMIASRTDPEYAVPCTDDHETVRFPLLAPPASQSEPPQPILDDSGNARTIKACDAIMLLEAIENDHSQKWAGDEA